VNGSCSNKIEPGIEVEPEERNSMSPEVLYPLMGRGDFLLRDCNPFESVEELGSIN
jgi:hypothetical protein